MKNLRPRKETSPSAAREQKRCSRSGISRQQCTCRRYKPYEGILLDPIKSYVVKRNGDVSVLPTWFKISRYPEEVWARLQSEEEKQRAKRLEALYRHYGIDPNHPGSSKDLAFTLALWHEGILEEHGAVTFSQLYGKYGIDPTSPKADTELVLKLAEKHIEGFRVEQRIPGESKKTVRSNDQLHALFNVILKIGIALTRSEDCSPSARKIAKVIVSPTRPKQISSDVWEEIKELRSKYPGGYETIRKHVSAILKARESYSEGKPNPLQAQLVKCSEENVYLRLWLMDRHEFVEELVDILAGRGGWDSLPKSLSP